MRGQAHRLDRRVYLKHRLLLAGCLLRLGLHCSAGARRTSMVHVFPNPTHLPSPAASSAAMIDDEHNTVRPDPGTANDARPPITFLCLARSRRRSSSSSVHASSNDRIPCQHPSAA
ncbi:hypothetical protein ACLOJK_018763 [Asimina triloba]